MNWGLRTDLEKSCLSLVCRPHDPVVPLQPWGTARCTALRGSNQVEPPDSTILSIPLRPSLSFQLPSHARQSLQPGFTPPVSTRSMPLRPVSLKRSITYRGRLDT